MGQFAGSLIKIGQKVRGIQLVDLDQSVTNSQAGTLFKIEQAVILRNTFAGTLINIEQSVKNDFVGNLLTIEQTVNSAAQATDVQKYGWTLHLYINNVEVPHNMINGNIDVSRAENSASLMNVTIINETGSIGFAEYHGQSIKLDVETSAGITRMYTGTVDIPEFDLINKLITLRCTDKRTEQINGQLGNQLKFIGRWSDAIFQEPKDVAEELSNRLLTTTKTVDFDPHGIYTISDFLPKTVPDFVLNDAAIYRRRPQLSIASRGRLVNRINLDFEFRYVRLRHRQRSFQLDGPQFCDVMSNAGLAFLSVDGIQSNLDSFGWNVKASSINYVYLPPGGLYNCGFGRFFWAPFSADVQTATKKDKDGKVITDSNGNAIIEVTGSSYTDYTKAFATQVNWLAAKQFAQDISQKITVQVNAPQSQNQYGIIEQSQRNGLGVEFDTQEWEKNDEYKSVPSGFTSTSSDSYQDQYGSLSDYDNALNTAIDIAKTKIARSHRDNHVTLQVPLWPEIDLKHTVETTAGVIQSKGKVSQIRHTFNINDRFAETEVQLALSKSVGSQADDTLNIPIQAAPLIGDPFVSSYKMNTYELQSGFNIGGVSNPIKELGMYTPPIDDTSRNRQETTANYTLNVSVRDDLLTVVY